MSIRAFGRLRTNTGAPLVSPTNANAIKTGELVASLAGKLYLGVGPPGGNATQVYTFEPTGSSGSEAEREAGGIVYSDESAQSGETYLLLAAPVRLTLTSIAARTGAGTCSLAIKSGGTTYAPTVTATNSIATTTIAGNELARRVEAGQPLVLAISNATNLTSLIVQVSWLEG